MRFPYEQEKKQPKEQSFIEFFDHLLGVFDYFL